MNLVEAIMVLVELQLRPTDVIHLLGHVVPRQLRHRFQVPSDYLPQQFNLVFRVGTVSD